jgi:hypothetical protein
MDQLLPNKSLFVSRCLALGPLCRTWESSALLLDALEALAGYGQSTCDDLVHIVVLVAGQAAAEDDARQLFLERGVIVVHVAVGGEVDRVVGLVGVDVGELFHDERGLWIPGALEVEVLGLVNSGEGSIFVGEVHHRDALVVGDVVAFELKADRAPVEVAVAVVEVAIAGASVYNSYQNET